MSILKHPTTGPATWNAVEISHDQQWLKSLTPEFITAIDAALGSLQSKNRCYPHFGKDDFPLDSQQSFMQSLADELEHGRGFFVLKGLPIDNYSESDIEALYFGIGLHLGTPVYQNPQGHLLG
ncbi:MAG: TauD/TfdA family dioxygenase, partial [Pseudomonadota bacterium]